MSAEPLATGATLTPGTSPANGAWAPLPPQPATRPATRLRVNGRAPLLGASGTFHFTPSPAGSPLADSTVRLDPAATKLRDGGRPLLRSGEQAKDTPYGNTVKAGGPGPLRTEAGAA